MASLYKHSSVTDLGVIMNNVAVSSGGGTATSTTIDNTTNREVYADLIVSVSAGSTPTSSPFLEIRLLYSEDNVSFETGAVGEKLDLIPITAGTTLNFVRGIHVDPYYIRALAVNLSNVSVNVTIKAKLRSMQFVAV